MVKKTGFVILVAATLLLCIFIFWVMIRLPII